MWCHHYKFKLQPDQVTTIPEDQTTNVKKVTQFFPKKRTMFCFCGEPRSPDNWIVTWYSQIQRRHCVSFSEPQTVLRCARFCWNVYIFHLSVHKLLVHATRITWFYREKSIWNEQVPFVNKLMMCARQQNLSKMSTSLDLPFLKTRLTSVDTKVWFWSWGEKVWMIWQTPVLNWYPLHLSSPEQLQHNMWDNLSWSRWLNQFRTWVCKRREGFETQCSSTGVRLRGESEKFIAHI